MFYSKECGSLLMSLGRLEATSWRSMEPTLSFQIWVPLVIIMAPCYKYTHSQHIVSTPLESIRGSLCLYKLLLHRGQWSGQSQRLLDSCGLVRRSQSQWIHNHQQVSRKALLLPAGEGCYFTCHKQANRSDIFKVFVKISVGYGLLFIHFLCYDFSKQKL